MQFRFQDFLQPSLVSFSSTDGVITQLPLHLGFLLSEVGVNLFFIISGFLITSLLLREERMRGSINVTAFYMRRVFRILPAFYAYLLVIVALTLMVLSTFPTVMSCAAARF